MSPRAAAVTGIRPDFTRRSSLLLALCWAMSGGSGDGRCPLRKAWAVTSRFTTTGSETIPNGNYPDAIPRFIRGPLPAALGKYANGYILDVVRRGESFFASFM